MARTTDGRRPRGKVYREAEEAAERREKRFLRRQEDFRTLCLEEKEAFSEALTDVFKSLIRGRSNVGPLPNPADFAGVWEDTADAV